MVETKFQVIVSVQQMVSACSTESMSPTFKELFQRNFIKF